MRDEAGVVTGVFKPKDEEPYGRLNRELPPLSGCDARPYRGFTAKWIKWFHRILLSPIVGGFGRACLIPNLSYLSEAAASLLDRHLDSHLVPFTDVASFASPSFSYDWIDRHAASPERKVPKRLPEKVGSLQLFASGFRGAHLFNVLTSPLRVE